MEFETVIGLEVHAQLLTRSKIFCACSTRFGAPPNTNTCPVCLGLPGALPVLNRQAVAMAVKAALALNCRINSLSIFARKNYFYPDLPKGYQISQYEVPLAEEGKVRLTFREKNGSGGSLRKEFRIVRVHLEEDAGKSLHAEGGPSLVNLNRTGVPLIEIVTYPDFRSPREAVEFLAYLRRTFLYLEVCDGNMEEGSLRCDANVSVRPLGSSRLGTKVEIKNLNSFRFLQRALEYEVNRQAGILHQGGEVVQETRLWDEAREVTLAMRTKEEAHDYRYFPDPDLLPLEVPVAWQKELAAQLPELPEERRQRLMVQYGLGEEEAFQLTQTRGLADYFEEAAAAGIPPREVYNWMMGDLTRLCKEAGVEVDRGPIPPGRLAGLLALMGQGTLSGKLAKGVLEEMFRSGEEAESIVRRKGLVQISDEGELSRLVQEVISAHPREVESYRAGKKAVLGFLVGQIMKGTGGRANPKRVNELLRNRLEEAE